MLEILLAIFKVHGHRNYIVKKLLYYLCNITAHFLDLKLHSQSGHSLLMQVASKEEIYCVMYTWII